MTRRALVTGGAGFIGSHVSDLFIARGYEVDIVDNLSSGKRENVPAKARLHVMDVASPEVARFVTETPFDVIVHLAAQIDVRKSVADPVADARVNVMGSISLLEAVRTKTAGPKPRFVFSSTGGAVYGDFAKPPYRETTQKEPESPYAIAKLSVEYYMAYYARVHGLDTATVRFANVYGPRQDAHGEAGVVAIFCGRLLEGVPLKVFGDGRQTRDYVYVGDVAEVTYRAATSKLPAAGAIDARAFNVGTGIETSVIELATQLQAVAKSPTPLEFAPKRPGEAERSVLIVEKALAALGWRPQTSLADGLAETYAYFAARSATATAPRG
jgi:UDP-glucose 4-epimerase